MIKDLDALITSYERGTVTRRQLLLALALMTTPLAAGVQTPPGGVMKGRNLHHVNVQVSDVARFLGQRSGRPARAGLSGRLECLARFIREGADFGASAS